MVKLANMSRGGMGGAGFLPAAGGSADQSILMMRCFDIILGAAEKARAIK